MYVRNTAIQGHTTTRNKAGELGAGGGVGGVGGETGGWGAGPGIKMQTTPFSTITFHLGLIKTSKQSWLETSVERFLLLSLSDGGDH